MKIFPVYAEQTIRWYTNGTVVSEIDFEKLRSSHRIYITKSLKDFQNDTDVTQKSDRIPSKIIEHLIQIYSSSNHSAVKNFLQTKLLLDSETSQTLAEKIKNLIQQNEGKTIEEILNKENIIKYQSLIERPPQKGLILEQGDRIGSVIIEKFGQSEDIVEVHGRVKGSVNNMKLEADKIVVNAKIMNVLATGNLRLESGNIVLRGDRAMFNIDTQRGFVMQPRGKVDLIHFQGDIGKFNTGEHITVLDARGDVEGNPDDVAPFNFSASTVESFGDEKIILNNLFLYVHDVPVFYFPLGFQNPFGTGVILRYGFTDREGLFLQNSFSLKFPLIGDINFNLDFYEKVGLYFQMQNSGSFLKSSYNASLAIAQTKEGKYNMAKGKMYYYGFFEPTLEENSILRFKYNFDQSFRLGSKESQAKGISSSFNYKLKGARYIDSLGVLRHDPYFSSEIEGLSPRQFKYIDLIKTSPYYESILYSSASDKDKYSFSFVQSLPGSSFALKGDWDYFLIQATDKNIPLVPTTKLPQKQYLGKVSLPVVDFSYTGVIDPVKEIDENNQKDTEKKSKRQYLNMQYNFSGNYKYESFYEFSHKLGNSEFIRHQNNFNIAFSTSRNWNFNKNLKEELFRLGEIFYNVSFNTGYNRQWGGEEIDFKYGEANKNNTYFRLGFSQNATLLSPSKMMREKLSRSFGYFSIIPYLELSATHKVGLRHFFETIDVEKNDNLNKRMFPDVWESHSITSSIKANQNLYGIFSIPGLDMEHNASSSVAYDLREDMKNNIQITIPYLDESRFQSWGANYTAKIFYEIPRWKIKVMEANYNFRQEIFNSSTRKIDPRPLYQSISWEVKYSKPQNEKIKIPWEDHISCKEAYLITSYNYYFGGKSYKQDSFSVKVGAKVDLVKYINIHAYVDSGTSEAYLYSSHKASAFKKDSVNFLYDIFQSMGFVGTDEDSRLKNRINSVLKLKRIGISISQDMGSWELGISYSINPKALGIPGIIKGFYMNQEIALKINLKSDYKVLKLLKDTIQPWNLNIKPRILDQL